MSFKKRRTYARSIIILYAFITVTFPLAHNDFVPLDVRLSLYPVDFHSNSVDSNANDLVCPAHNFAQSTTGTAAFTQDVPSLEHFSFLEAEHHDHLFAAPAYNLSARAPPQA
jgi:hypothetical protein